jgi:hypothetical protein
MLEIAFDVEGLMFLLKQMEDLEALINCPDHLQYLSKQDFMLATSVTVAFPNHFQNKGLATPKAKIWLWGLSKSKNPSSSHFSIFVFPLKKLMQF